MAELNERFLAAELTYHDDELRPGLAIGVDGSRISRVLQRDEVPEGADVEELGRVALLPGTVNAHGHAFQHVLRGRMDDQQWEPAIEHVMYPAAERLTPEHLYVTAKLAFSDALLAGITTFVDFFYLNDGANDNARLVVRAAKEVGIRLVLARCFFDENVSWSVPARYCEPAQLAYQNLTELAGEFADDPAVTVQPAPHSLRAASPETLRLALRAANELGAPCHLHLNNQSKERMQNVRGYGQDPISFMRKEGLLTEDLILVHGKPLSDDEMDIIAEAGAPVVHCPGPDFKSGGGVTNVPGLLAHGVRVGLGCDSGCVNNRQSMFDEMRTFALLHRYGRDARECLVDAPLALRTATAVNADILRLPVGRVVESSLADFVALDMEHPSLLPTDTIGQNIVYSMSPAAITKVMVDGRWVADGGRLTTIDHSNLAERFGAVVRDVFAG